MPDHLVFTLAATLGAMGDLAGHERRGSWDWPGRSAVLGLMAAACGIRRDGDFAALDRLVVSVAVFAAGDPLRDYHTVETIPTAVARRPQSRPQALRGGAGRTNTTITLRDYRQGVVYAVAVAGGDLPALQAALQRPVFTLYLGRKSCPLSAPLAPVIVTAGDAAAAVAQARLPPWAAGLVPQTLYADAPAGQGSFIRHDAPADRAAWHFSPRAVQAASLKGQE